MAKTFGVVFELGAKLQGSVASAFSTVESRLGNLNKSLAQLKKENEGPRRAAEKLMDTYSRLKLKEADYAKNQTNETKRALERAQRAFDRASNAAKEYGLNIDNVSEAKLRLQRRSDALQRKLDRQEFFKQQAVVRQERQSRMWEAVAMVGAAAMPIKLAVEHEAAMADFRKVSSLSENEGKIFDDRIRKMSHQMARSTEGLYATATAGMQTGMFKTLGEITQFTSDVAKVAVAFDVDDRRAGSITTGLMTNFRLDLAGAQKVLDAYNHLSNNMDATAAYISDFGERSGGMAGLFGLSGEEAAAYAATFQATKTEVSSASNAFNKMFERLNNAPRATAEAQEAFARLGFNVEQLSRDMQGGRASEAILEFLEAVKKSDDSFGDLSATIGNEFADEIVKVVNKMDLLKKALGYVADETSFLDSVQKEFASRSATDGNKLALFKNQIIDVGISLGNALLPPIVAFAEVAGKLAVPVVSFIEAYPELVAGVGIVGAAFVAATGLAFVASVGITALSVAMGILASPVLLVAGAVVALASGLIFLWDNIKDIVGWGPETGGVASRMYTPSVDNAKASTRPKAEPTFMDKLFLAGGARMHTPTVAEKVKTATAPVAIVAAPETSTVANFASVVESLESTVGGLPAELSKVMTTMDTATPESTNNLISSLTDLAAKFNPLTGASPLGAATQAAAPVLPEPIKAVLDSASLKLPPAQNTINSPVTQTLNITMHGIPDREFAQRVMDAVRANSGHFQSMITSTVSAALARAKATSYEAS